MIRKCSFPPVVDENVRVLVLGSLPGELSLAQGQYYANPQNKFWTLMSEVIGEKLNKLTYPERLQSLLRHGVGLWDSVAEAIREGSLDSRIRDHDHNDLVGLVERSPKLEAIAFNGGTAAKLGLKALGDYASRYQVIRLPSSSPAYTLSYQEKLNVWLMLRNWVN